MKIICVGHAAWDITIPVVEFPLENTKNRYSNMIEGFGGPALSASYLLGKWGLEPYYIGTVGNDNYGKSILSTINSVGVNTDFTHVKNEPTTKSVILANTTNGSRTILTYQNGDICQSDSYLLPFEPDIMLFDGQEYALTKRFLSEYPNCISVMDAGKATLNNIELAKKATYVVCSREFAESLAGQKINIANKESLAYIYNVVKKDLPGNLVITLGKYGCIYEQDGQLKVKGIINTEVVDTTGAGDIFHGAFVYGLANKLEIEDIIHLATVTSGLSVEHLGVQNSILPLETVKKVYYDTK